MSQLVFDSPKYKSWKRNIESHGITLDQIEVIGEISSNGTSLFTALLDCQLTTPEGITMPRSVVLQGDGTIVIPVLNCVEDQTVYTLMVEQRRVVDGSFTTEFPAGTVEPSIEDSIIVAVQELEEELGMQVSTEELQLLHPYPLKADPSILSAIFHYFYFEREVTQAFLKEMDGRETGCLEDHEYIRVKVQKMSEVSQTNQATFSLAGLKLLENKLGKTFK